ncbi:MAG: radical SAM protein [bacterium]
MNILYVSKERQLNYLLSYLENEIDGFKYQELIDLNNLTNTPDTYLLLTTGIGNFSFENSLRTILFIRKNFKTVKLNIVLGGTWTSLINVKQFQQAFPEVKYICVGEGEGFLKTLFTQGLEPGIYYGNNFDNPKNYYLTDNQFHNLINSNRLDDPSVYLTFEGNGCRWGKCLFCHHISCDVKEYASPEQLFETIDRYAIERNHHRFYLYDNYTNIDKLNELIGLISKTKYKDKMELKIFGLKVSDDFSKLDDNMAKFNSSPLRDIQIGVEFYEQRLLNLYRKGITIKQIDDTLTWASKQGIVPSSYIMLGVPGATSKTRQSYIDFYNKWFNTHNLISFFVLSNLTRIYQDNLLKDFGIEITGNNFKIHELLDLKEFNIGSVDTVYMRFKHWDDEEEHWITREEDYKRHENIINFLKR